METARTPQLDGVRGIAILLVLIWHWQAAFPVEPGSSTAYAMRLFYLSWSGVDLFFVLSGFLIGGMLIDNRETENYLPGFYFRRAIRILPLYLAIVLLGWLSSAVKILPFDFVPAGQYFSLPLFLTFTQNVWMADEWSIGWSLWLGQTWSLAVEVQFYLLVPIVLWLLPKRLLPYFSIVLVFTALFLRCLSYAIFPEGQAGTIAHVLLPCRMDSLAIGFLVALAVRDGRAHSWLSRNLGALYLLFALLIVLIAVFVLRSWGLGHFFMQTIGLSVLALFYGVFLLIALSETRGPIAWLTNLAGLRRLGIWSYCIYLIHGFIPPALFGAYGASAEMLVVAIAVLLLAAFLSWRYVESPLISLGHHQKITVAGPRRRA